MKHSAFSRLVVGVLILACGLPAAASEWRPDWPVLRTYDRDHIDKIALPLGGIGTGTVSLGGRGNLVDWEIMNRPAKGYVPFVGQQLGPFFAIRVSSADSSFARALEGPLPLYAYEASHGSTAELTVLHGGLSLKSLKLGNAAPRTFKQPKTITAGEMIKADF